MKLCKCGCGKPVRKPEHDYIHGHNRKGYKLTESELKIKSDRVTQYYKDNIVSDETKEKQSISTSKRFHDNPMTEDHKKKIGDGNRGKVVSDITKNRMSIYHSNRPKEHQDHLNESLIGVKRSIEGCHNISVGIQAFYDSLDNPGDQIVGHHMIYDHSDLTKNIMPMTRSMHARLHQLFRKYRIEIPHINIKEEL